MNLRKIVMVSISVVCLGSMIIGSSVLAIGDEIDSCKDKAKVRTGGIRTDDAISTRGS